MTWMTSDVINAALVELRVATRGSKSYLLLSSETAAMLRIGRRAVTLVEAQKAADEVACEAGDYDMVGLVINLLKQHWVSAFADINNRCITVFDSLASIQAEEKAVAVGRVMMLCDAVVARRQQSLSSPGQQGNSPGALSSATLRGSWTPAAVVRSLWRTLLAPCVGQPCLLASEATFSVSPCCTTSSLKAECTRARALRILC